MRLHRGVLVVALVAATVSAADSAKAEEPAPHPEPQSGTEAVTTMTTIAEDDPLEARGFASLRISLRPSATRCWLMGLPSRLSFLRELLNSIEQM